MIAPTMLCRAIGAGVLALIVGSCNGRKTSPDVLRANEAIDLVERFIALDLAGRGFLPEAVSLFEECDVPGGDQIEPVLEVRVAPLTPRGDTTLASLSYSLVGVAFGQENMALRDGRWTFRFVPLTRVDTIRVAPSSASDRLRIVCGPHYGNRPDVGSLAWLVPRLDSAGRAEWERARLYARARNRSLP